MKPLKGFAAPRGPLIFPSPAQMAKAAQKRRSAVEPARIETTQEEEKPRRKWKKYR